MKIIKFNSDTKHRKQWFTGVSFSHPAKMMLPLQLWLIENFTKEGETILDPMAGSGTLLVACSMGRNVICVELESKFVDMMKGNWGKIQQRGPQMGYQMGDALILQGDARNLIGILADKIISSPTYGNPRNTSEEYDDRYDLRRPKGVAWGRESFRGRYGETEGQIGDLPYGSIDAVISSPPYEYSVSDKTDPAGERRKERLFQAGYNPDEVMGFDTPGNIGHWHQSYSRNAENIGNKSGGSYLSAMLQVYQQCHAVLKDGGLMVLVLKNFIRNKAIVRLDLDTIRLCEQAGFIFQDRWYRKLTSQSFWRIIYQREFPDVPVLDTEDILVFRK